MNDSFGGDFNLTQSTAGAASDQKHEGIAPVFIRQIVESPEGNFQMFNMTFSMVSCVAIVRSIDTSSTKVTYLLEDHTGRIEAHYWLEEGDSLKAPNLMINNYARVFGSVRTQGGGSKALMIFRMFPVTDPNELCTHCLEVMNVRFKAEKMVNNEDSSEVKTSNDINLGLQGKNLAIYMAVKNRADETGISRNELQQKFKHIDSKELNGIISFLSNEGHIYSSTDPDHFVSTD